MEDDPFLGSLRRPRGSQPLAFEMEQRAAASPLSRSSYLLSSRSLMSSVQASHPLPLSWCLTGKRGRKKLHGRPDDEDIQEHDVARLLLKLSSPSPSAGRCDADVPHQGSPRGCETDSWEEEAARSDGGEGERRRRLRRAATAAALHECEVCTRKFRTGRALGGHMKNHWERDLKGRIVKKKMRKVSTLGLGLRPPFDRTPPPPSSPATGHWVVCGERGEREAAGGGRGSNSFEKRTGVGSSPSTTLLLSY